MMKLPPLIELRAFEAAARHMSFKKAALELGVSPTAVSHQIKLLELYCGKALFRRRPRPLSLTEAGSRLFPVIHDGLSAVSTAIDAIKSADDRQPLRVTTTNAFASRWLVPRLSHWQTLQPGSPLDVIGTDQVIDLQAGDADIAIRYARALPRHNGAERFLQDRFWPVCRPHLLAAHGPLKTPADLRRHVLIHYAWPPTDPDAPTWRQWLTAAQVKWSDAPEFEDMKHLTFREEPHAIEAVIAGQGIGILSDVLVAAELADGTLVKAFDLSLPGYQFFIVHPPNHPRVKTIKAFINWLRTLEAPRPTTG